MKKNNSSATRSLGLSKQNLIIKKNVSYWQLYVMLAVPVCFCIIFNYIPMYGVIIAFKNYSAMKGIIASPWVGLENFIRFFNNYDALRVVTNTLKLSVYGILMGFPFSILLAIMLHYLIGTRYKKIVQMTSYAPYFISIVVVVGIINQVFARAGVINNFLFNIFNIRMDFFGSPNAFVNLYVWSNIWQSTGFGSIIYLGILANVDTQLHEAAIVDGATKIRRIWHIDLPAIMPTAIILLILSTGSILNVGFEKILLMQNPMNLSSSEVVSTYVYKLGFASMLPDYSYSAAIGLFQSAVGLILIVTVNNIAKRINVTSIW